MDIERFVATFETQFPPEEIARISLPYEEEGVRQRYDPCPDVEGMVSVKKQQLLRLAFACIGEGECYLEVGTYQGKSLLSAAMGNISRPCYACDDFSQCSIPNARERLLSNLERYGLRDRVVFFPTDFRGNLTPSHIREAVGLYFYDGAHDYESHYQAIRLVEPLLAPVALVIIDVWRFAADSQSYARVATKQAIIESSRRWRQLYNLPARHNGDHAMWWNGVAVFASCA